MAAIESVAREISATTSADAIEAVRVADEITSPAQLAAEVRRLMHDARTIYDRAIAADRFDTALRALQRIEAQCILLLRMQNAIQPDSVTLVGVNTNGASPVDELRRRLDAIAARECDSSTARAITAAVSERAPRPEAEDAGIAEAIATRDDGRALAARFRTVQG